MDSNQSFKEWLTDNTKLSERSIDLYVRTVNRFLEKYAGPSIENINNFIAESFRNSASYYVKYAFKFYLQFLRREMDYYKLVKVKVKPTEKIGCYVTKDILESIVNGIDDPIYQRVALIQYVTGKRAHDVLGVKRDNVMKLEDGALRIRFLPKGERREVFGFIPIVFVAPIVELIDHTSKEYPFLKGEGKTFVKLVNNNYHKYEMKIKKSALKVNQPTFASHDFKRNFLEEFYIASGKDIHLTQQAGDHLQFETTLRYFKRIQEEDMKTVVEKVRG